jgi:hypothetical protein
MHQWFLVLTFLCIYRFSLGQVQPSFLYNTGMPYGTLDIRTRVSASNYFYLKEGETYSYRETSPGVKSKTYLDMTDWDSSPYEEGHMRHAKGQQDEFIMNYRLLKPVNYDENFSEGYPMILMMHGGYERANCHFNDCFHADWNYDPVTNLPPAPSDPQSKLLNNDFNLNLGGRQHIDARNKAGQRLPDSPDLDERAFPGFVLIPQMMNDWDSLSVQNAIRIVLLHADQYNINMDRIYVHGLSAGGHAVYQAIKRAPWLFAAAMPMSAVNDGYIFKQGLQNTVANIPIWIFQGGEDPRPTVEETKDRIQKLKDAGATVRYTEYPELGHAVWNRAYGEDDFFSFMLAKSKANIYPLKGNTAIVEAENVYPTLVLPEGFFAYQWERDGEIIEGSSHALIADKPGTYRARFSRRPASSAQQWNRWSDPVLITRDGELVTGVEDPSRGTIEIYPNPASGNDLELIVGNNATTEVTIVDMMGRIVHREKIQPQSGTRRKLSPREFRDGIYQVIVHSNGMTTSKKLVIRRAP